MKTLSAFTENHPAEWLLSFDFDGTLVGHDEDPMVQPKLFQMIETMRVSHRALWGINTGRSLAHVLEGMLEAKFAFMPDFIIAREREIYLKNEFNRWVGIAEWNKNCEKAHKKLFRKNKKILKGLRKWVEANTQAQWGSQEGEPAGIVSTTVDEMNMIVQKIDEEITSAPDLSYQRNSIYLRFSHSAYHKGSALAEFARLKGIDLDKRFTMGDGHNDTDMLDKSIAQYIACPENSDDDVKQHVLSRGGFVAKGTASHGVIDALSVLLHTEEICIHE
ncbi:HAD hydrolase family protein [Akkermansiaceae bacterium]|nr:HAD hydrolase family protein [Akkermansiaceae bacterium]